MATDTGFQTIIFHIDAYSPATIPMAKLADYMADFAALLGAEHRVHFDHLAGGSTKIVSRVQFEDIPKIAGRLGDVGRGHMTKALARIFRTIDDRLANDNAAGRILLSDPEGQISGELLLFPGRNKPALQSYGPFTQEGHLDGILISVGGRDETISVRLRNGETIYTHCETTRVIARAMARHLFEPIRIHGTGRWQREADGSWTLLRFGVQSFDALDVASLRDAVTALRSVEGSGWKTMTGPLRELDDLRRDEDEMH